MGNAKTKTAAQKSLSALELIDNAVTDESWSAIFRALATTAIEGGSGSTQCAELLLKYRFPVPKPAVDQHAKDLKALRLYLPNLSASHGQTQ